MDNFSIIDDPDSSVYGTSRLSVLEPLRQVIDEADLAAAKRDDLETENLILRRNMPRLRDLQGKDITNEIILLEENLRIKDDKILELQGILDTERRKMTDFKELERGLLEKHQEQMRDFTQKYEKLRENVSIIEEGGGEDEDLVSEVRQDANKLVEETLRARIAELETQLTSNNEEILALRQENQELRGSVEDFHQKLEQAEQGNSALGYEYREAVRQLQEKDQQFRAQNKVINGLRKLLPPGIDERSIDWNNVDFDSKKFCVKKLLSTVNVLNPHWQENQDFKHQLELFVDSARGEDESTMSQVVDELTRERERLEKELSSIHPDTQDNEHHLDSYFGGVSPIPPTEEVLNESIKEVLNQTTPLVESLDWVRKKFFVMFSVLKGVPEFLDKLLEEMDIEDPRIAALLEKINSLKVDLNNSLTEMSENLHNMDGLADDLNESIAALDKNLGDPMMTSDKNRLLDEIQALRTNMKREISAKNELKMEKERHITQLQEDLEELQREIRRGQQERDVLEDQLEEKDEVIGALEKRISSANEALLETKRNVDEQETRTLRQEEIIETLKDHLRKYESQLGVLLEEKAAYVEGLKARDERLGEFEEQMREFEEREELISDLAKNLEKLESRGVRVETINSQRFQADSNFEKIRRIAEQLHNDRDEYANYLARLNRALTSGEFENFSRPEVVDEKAHAVFLELLRGTNDRILEKFSKAHTVLKAKIETINSARSDGHSVCSDMSTTEAMASTLDEIIRSFVECREVANHVVQLLKLRVVDPETTKVSFEGMLEKMRELRNKLHLSIKALQARRERVASRAGTMVVDELMKIHNVLKDVESTNKNIKSRQQLKEAVRKYRK